LNPPFRLEARPVDLPAVPLQKKALALALVLAAIAWLAAYALRTNGGFLVWDDQQATFTNAAHYLGDPYALPGLKNPPWALLPLIPFSFLSLPLATLIQMLIYFGLLAAVITRFGGGLGAVALTLTSPLALDAAINLNIDWLVAFGLLVPRPWSAPLLLLKPQNALGYLLSFGRRDLVRWVLVALVTVLLSLLLWGAWPLAMLEASRRYSVAWQINLAPQSVIGVPLALVIGLALAFTAYRRRDPVIGILSGLFFVPYIGSYSLLLPFGLVAARWFRPALIVGLALWIALFALLLTR
jgi:hypothetical protein